MTPHNTTPPTIIGHVNVCQSVSPKLSMNLLDKLLPSPLKEKTQVQRMWFKDGRQVTNVEGRRLSFIYDGNNNQNIGIMVRLRWRVKTRHQWRIKRIKPNRRLNKHKIGICPPNPF